MLVHSPTHATVAHTSSTHITANGTLSELRAPCPADSRLLSVWTFTERVLITFRRSKVRCACVCIFGSMLLVQLGFFFYHKRIKRVICFGMSFVWRMKRGRDGTVETNGQSQRCVCVSMVGKTDCIHTHTNRRKGQPK